MEPHILNYQRTSLEVSNAIHSGDIKLQESLLSSIICWIRLLSESRVVGKNSYEELPRFSKLRTELQIELGILPMRNSA